MRLGSTYAQPPYELPPFTRMSVAGVATRVAVPVAVAVAVGRPCWYCVCNQWSCNRLLNGVPTA